MAAELAPNVQGKKIPKLAGGAGGRGVAERGVKT